MQTFDMQFAAGPEMGSWVWKKVVLEADCLAALAEKEAKLTEEISIQDQMLNPGEHICEREINGVTICVLRKDLWDIRSTREAKEAREKIATLKTPWKCFNCGFETNDEVKAAAHFGEGEGESALCRHWWSMENAERAQAYQEVIGELNQERNENIILATENKRLRQIVIDCHAGWPDEVLQKALQGEKE